MLQFYSTIGMFQLYYKRLKVLYQFKGLSVVLGVTHGKQNKRIETVGYRRSLCAKTTYWSTRDLVL
jgi:hypothetical protein